MSIPGTRDFHHGLLAQPRWHRSRGRTNTDRLPDQQRMAQAPDFVEHCATRWESGKSMLICIDKITCARMLQLIAPRWQAKASSVRPAANTIEVKRL